MTLWDDLRLYLPDLRAAAESRMTETVQIGPEVDSGVGMETVWTVVPVYEGPARFILRSMASSDMVGADQPFDRQSPELHLPHGTQGVLVDHVAVIVGSTDDESLIGRRFRIAGLPQAGQTTAARYPVVEST